MKVFAVVGISGSGKTTTVERVIAGLVGRRYSVGSVKDIHFEQFAIDTPGSNTHRHKAAGAELVAARGLTETDILFPTRLSMDKLLAFYSHDWVALEGVTDLNVPQVVCAHSLEEADKKIGPSTIALAGVLANSGIKEYRGLPVFNALTQGDALVTYLEKKVFPMLPDYTAKCCGLCGMSCRELLAEIVLGNKGRDDCILAQRVSLKVGEHTIKMVPFVQDVLAKTLNGLVSTLEGYEPNQTIEIIIRPE